MGIPPPYWLYTPLYYPTIKKKCKEPYAKKGNPLREPDLPPFPFFPWKVMKMEIWTIVYRSGNLVKTIAIFYTENWYLKSFC